jgi:hypothetical protein
MAIRNVQVEALLGLDYYDAYKKLIGISLASKSVHEICCCYDVLTIWFDKFEHLGKLVSLNHHSNPDDPPDVKAMFDSERWLDMEHTSTEPAHRHKAQKLRGKIGGITPPISGIYKTKQALVEAMNPYAYGGWTSIQKEVDAKYQLIIKAIKNKIEKHPPGGILVLEGNDFIFDSTLPHLLRLANSEIWSVPKSEKWTYIYISRANGIDYYSAIFSPSIPFEERRPSPPDPSKIKRFFKNEDGSPYDGPWPPPCLQEKAKH